MIYCRVDLAKTRYTQLNGEWGINRFPAFSVLENIYRDYCRYKKFSSVMPIFEREMIDPANDVMVYYHENRIVAFSLLKKFNNKHVEAIQFAWDYQMPELNLGIRSLKHECAFYRDAGFDYLYLGGVDDYKTAIDGFEILGNPYV